MFTSLPPFLPSSPSLSLTYSLNLLLLQLLEWFIVGVAATPSCGTAASVLIMLAGAFVAAVHDLSFVLYGCVRVH